MYHKSRSKSAKNKELHYKRNLLQHNVPRHDEVAKNKDTNAITKQNVNGILGKNTNSKIVDLTSLDDTIVGFVKPPVKTYGKQNYYEKHFVTEPAILATLRVVNDIEEKEANSNRSALDATLHYDSNNLETTFDRLVREDKQTSKPANSAIQTSITDKNDSKWHIVNIHAPSRSMEEVHDLQFANKKSKNLKRKNESNLNTIQLKKLKTAHNQKKLKSKKKHKKHVKTIKSKHSLKLSINSSTSSLNSSKKILRTLLPRKFILPQKYLQQNNSSLNNSLKKHKSFNLNKENKSVSKNNIPNKQHSLVTNKKKTWSKIRLNGSKYVIKTSLKKKLKACRIVLQRCDNIIRQTKSPTKNKSLLKSCSIYLPRVVVHPASPILNNTSTSVNSLKSDISFIDSSVIKLQKPIRKDAGKDLDKFKTCSIHLTKMPSLELKRSLTVESKSWICSTPINNRLKIPELNNLSPVATCSFKKPDLLNTINRTNSSELEIKRNYSFKKSVTNEALNNTDTLLMSNMFNSIKKSLSQEIISIFNQSTLVNRHEGEEEEEEEVPVSLKNSDSSPNSSIYSNNTILNDDVEQKRSLLQALGLSCKNNSTSIEDDAQILKQASPMTCIPYNVIESLDSSSSKKSENSRKRSSSKHTINSLHLINRSNPRSPLKNSINSSNAMNDGLKKFTEYNDTKSFDISDGEKAKNTNLRTRSQSRHNSSFLHSKSDENIKRYIAAVSSNVCGESNSSSSINFVNSLNISNNISKTSTELDVTKSFDDLDSKEAKKTKSWLRYNLSSLLSINKDDDNIRKYIKAMTLDLPDESNSKSRSINSVNSLNITNDSLKNSMQLDTIKSFDVSNSEEVKKTSSRTKRLLRHNLSSSLLSTSDDNIKRYLSMTFDTPDESNSRSSSINLASSFNVSNNNNPKKSTQLLATKFFNNSSFKKSDKSNSRLKNQSVYSANSLNTINNTSEISKSSLTLTADLQKSQDLINKDEIKKIDTEPFVLLSRLKDPVRITSQRNKYVKWNLSAISEDKTLKEKLLQNQILQRKKSSIVNGTSNLLNDTFNQSSESLTDNDLKQPVFLKPGKYWARSLSILHNVQNEQDFEELSQGKGKKWRSSVQSVLDMQNACDSTPYTSQNQYLNDSKSHEIASIRKRSKGIQDHNSLTSSNLRLSLHIVPNKKKEINDNDSSFLKANGIESRVSKKIVSKRSTLLPIPRGSTIHRITDEDIETEVILTPKDIVLEKCGQTDYLPFHKCYSEMYLKRCRKIGEGLYGEVFLYEYKNDKSVIKIIPIEGKKLVNGEPQKKFSEILSEILIAKELHNLRNDKMNNTDRFVEVKSIKCIIGKYPKTLIKIWNDYNDEKESDNDCPTMFDDDQLYIILELGHGGRDLEAFEFLNANEAYAIFVQIAVALAVAEKSLEFEHRDLHWGNVLISHTKETEVKYIICGEEFKCPTNGVKVSIIDYTLSRMWYQRCCIFNDLSVDPSLFTAQGEYQFEIYRLMRAKTGNDWQRFEPYTNVLWLHYTLVQMIKAARYKNSKSKLHKQAIAKLQALKNSILDYASAHDLVINCDKF